MLLPCSRFVFKIQFNAIYENIITDYRIMENKFTNIKERVVKVSENKLISKKKFYQEIEMLQEKSIIHQPPRSEIIFLHH